MKVKCKEGFMSSVAGWINKGEILEVRNRCYYRGNDFVCGDNSTHGENYFVLYIESNIITLEDDISNSFGRLYNVEYRWGNGEHHTFTGILTNMDVNEAWFRVDGCTAKINKDKIVWMLPNQDDKKVYNSSSIDLTKAKGVIYRGKTDNIMVNGQFYPFEFYPFEIEGLKRKYMIGTSAQYFVGGLQSSPIMSGVSNLDLSNPLQPQYEYYF